MPSPKLPTRPQRPTLSLRIDLPNGGRLGPGKIALLETVRELSSIAAAARRHGMSYRRAWLLIDDMNRAYREIVVETFPGRSQSIGAQVTPFGETLIALYKRAAERADQSMAAEFEELTRLLNPDYERGPAPPLRRGKTDRDA